MQTVKQDEKIKLQKVNEVNSKIRSLYSNIETLKKNIDESRLSLHQKVISNRGMGNLSGIQGAYEQKLLSGISENHRVVYLLRKEEMLARQEYERVFKKRKVLEKLEEKQKLEYLEDKKKMQNKFYDEVMINNFYIKRNTNGSGNM